MPPWMKPDADDSGDGKDSGDDDACKGAHAWALVDTGSPVPGIRCEKCKTTPAEAAGLSGTHDMQAAPIPDLLESPPMASTKSRSEEHTSDLQSLRHLVCRLLLDK